MCELFAISGHDYRLLGDLSLVCELFAKSISGHHYRLLGVSLWCANCLLKVSLVTTIACGETLSGVQIVC
jgi:hypothetical protein